MLDQNAINYLVELGRDEKKVIEIGGQPYTRMPLSIVKKPSVSAVVVHTLDALVDIIKSVAEVAAVTEDGYIDYIHIEDAETVHILGPVREDRTREIYATAKAELPREINYGSYYDTETFNIFLQSRFIRTPDKDLLLKFTGLIKEENVRNTGDDGISQAVTIKTGIASVGSAVVPNPVVLKPWRTFQEIEQPESQFIFRMKDGPSAALFEADGGAWRLKAIKRIHDYLKEALAKTGEEFIILA